MKRNNDNIIIQKILFIINNLDKGSLEAFIRDIILVRNDNERLEDIIEQWLIPAEINSNPIRKIKVLDRMRQIKKLSEDL